MSFVGTGRARVERAAHRLAQQVRASGATVAVAESLTCGRIASALGAVPHSSDWLHGGVVAYVDEVKFAVLGVTPGPVVSRRCAAEMAEGVAALLDADIGIAVTGVGGPAHEGEDPPGTVFVAVHAHGGTAVEQRHFPGSTDVVLEATVWAALELAYRRLTAGVSDSPTVSPSPSEPSRTRTAPRRGEDRRSRSR